MVRELLPSMLVAILLQEFSLSAMAAPGDTFSPFVSASMTHDSNLLRIDQAANSANSADTIRQTLVGMSVDWKLDRQHFLLTADVNDNRFDKFSVLNYQGRDAAGRWNWELGNHLSGALGYTNNLTLGSFADQRGLVGNQRTWERKFFDGRWLLHPSWKAGVGISKNKLSYGDIRQRAFNREDDAMEATLQYLSSANNTIGILLRDTDGSYPNQTVDYISMTDNGYHQREVLATLDWNYDGHSIIHGQAGGVQRKHDHFSSRDYRSINARGNYTWLATGKLKLNASAWREVTAYDDLTSSYSLNRGLSLEPTWAATSSIAVIGKIRHETRDFLGDPGILALPTMRRDTYNARTLAISYQAARSTSVNISWSNERRESNRPLFGFYSEAVSVSATFQM